MRRTILASTLTCLALAACDSGNTDGKVAGPDEEIEQPGDAGIATSDASERPAKLALCVSCHTFEQDGPNRIGPNLWNVHGEPAASKSGYAYSTALRESGLVWDGASLHAYLANPRTTVPGGKMSFSGLRNEGDRMEIIAYLETLQPSAE